jgi:hypothetical protein
LDSLALSIPYYLCQPIAPPPPFSTPPLAVSLLLHLTIFIPPQTRLTLSGLKLILSGSGIQFSTTFPHDKAGAFRIQKETPTFCRFKRSQLNLKSTLGITCRTITFFLPRFTFQIRINKSAKGVRIKMPQFINLPATTTLIHVQC